MNFIFILFLPMMKITTLVNINLDRIENVSSVSKIFGKGIRIFPSFNPRFKIIDIFSSIYSSNKGTNKRLKRFNSVAAAAAAGNSRTKPVRSYEISRCRKLLAFLGGTCNVAFH